MKTGLLTLGGSTNSAVSRGNGVVMASATELAELAESVVARGGTAIMEIRGNSMNPMLRTRKSLVSLSTPDCLAVGDVLLYRYPNGKCVLHRLVRITQDGSLLCRGDNNARTERIRRDWIIARAVAFSRSGRWISCDSRLYRMYWKSWLALWPARRVVYLALRLLRRVFRSDDAAV